MSARRRFIGALTRRGIPDGPPEQITDITMRLGWGDAENFTVQLAFDEPRNRSITHYDVEEHTASDASGTPRQVLRLNRYLSAQQRVVNFALPAAVDPEPPTTTPPESERVIRYYRIRAVNADGDGPWSDIISSDLPDQQVRTIITRNSNESSVDWFRESNDLGSAIGDRNIDGLATSSALALFNRFRFTSNDIIINKTSGSSISTWLASTDADDIDLFVLNAEDGEFRIDLDSGAAQESIGNNFARLNTTEGDRDVLDEIGGGDPFAVIICDQTANIGNIVDNGIDEYPTALPSAPVLRSGTITATTAEIEWDDPPDGEGWTGVQYSAGGGTWTTIPGWPLSEYIIGSLLPGQSYTVTLRAVNNVGHGASSNAVSFTTDGPPGGVRNLEGTATETGASLRWDPPASDGGSPILRYEVRQRRDDVLSWGSWTSGTILTRSVTGLTGGRRYRWEVRAVNAHGSGIATSIVLQTTSPLGAVRNFTWTRVQGIATAISLSWDPPIQNAGLVDYELRWRAHPGTGDVWPDTTTVTGLSHVLTGLTRGQSYEVDIRARGGSPGSYHYGPWQPSGAIT